jgi:hypothetical protein
MIGVTNKDSSFFTVESPDIELSSTDFSKDLMSLSIVEKMGSMPRGTLKFNDPNHYYSRVMRTGLRLLPTWGYRDRDTIPESVITKVLNIDEVTGDLVRRGYEGFVSGPSGGGDASGVVTYNCNFSAFGFRGVQASKVYSEGTKKSVIEKAFNDIGVTERFIDFTLGNDALNSNHSVRQDETTYAFLTRLAIEWRTLFYIAFSPKGTPVGVFIDMNKIGTTSLPSWVLGATGGSNALGYKGELNNVISYTWTSGESENGVGDNVRLDIVDGQIIFRQYVAEEEKVITYRLDQQKIQEVYADAGAEGLSSQLALTRELLSKQDFQSIKHFFIPVEQTTAPSGYGYRIKAKMIGNPLYIPGNIIKINNGFPDRLGGSQSIWFIHSVTHNIDRAGYNMDIEVVDVFNLSPIGMPIR